MNKILRKNDIRVFLKRSLILLFLSHTWVTLHASTREEINDILSQPHDVDLVANTLRTRLGRANITRQQAKEAVVAFRNHQSWQQFVPAGLLKKPTLPPKPSRLQAGTKSSS